MAQSTVKSVNVDNDTHTIAITIAHSDYTSFSRSVIPCANKAFDKFMRSPEGREWINAGFYRFSTDCNFGFADSVSVITYSITN